MFFSHWWYCRWKTATVDQSRFIHSSIQAAHMPHSLYRFMSFSHIEVYGVCRVSYQFDGIVLSSIFCVSKVKLCLFISGSIEMEMFFLSSKSNSIFSTETLPLISLNRQIQRHSQQLEQIFYTRWTSHKESFERNPFNRYMWKVFWYL